ncbi:MAG: bifunctional adenosylcobinamide kinase/adenosylcobinamide-phosphate guanylyltransferase [Candidatus Omnitrophota bacterium]
MGKITFIFGGARSGKSSFSVKIAKARRVAFIATCEPRDCEMKKRITSHQNSRPSFWKTFEEPLNVAALIRKISGEYDLILIDCITLLLCNLLLKRFSEEKIEKEILGIISALKKGKVDSVLISNEVGMGIVPRNKLSREFRDIQGRANQIIAKESSKVYFMLAGIPLRIKGG